MRGEVTAAVDSCMLDSLPCFRNKLLCPVITKKKKGESFDLLHRSLPFSSLDACVASRRLHEAAGVGAVHPGQREGEPRRAVKLLLLLVVVPCSANGHRLVRLHRRRQHLKGVYDHCGL